jgi:hypothetical protein
MALELADIFHDYGSAYRELYGEKMPPRHRTVMRAIELCRTEALGGQMYDCPDCSHIEYRYHSCRNRHCPKCQQAQGQAWLEKQQALLLPVPYFLLTFTLPASLRQFARRHQLLYYDLLFRASAEAAQQLARDPRFIGGQIGLVGVLHTWTRDLRYHPHIHYLAPAGGLADDGTWQPAHKKFFMPVKALSRLFRAHFQQALQKTEDYAEIPKAAWSQPWVVHCKLVGSGQTALKYLAPYIFRVALSNRRLVRLEHDQVTFRYKDARSGQSKLCTLPALSFIHRFLQHVLPRGFVKVRYYGLFAPGNRKALPALSQHLLAASASSPASVEPNPAIVSMLSTSTLSTGDPLRCPACGQLMRLRQTLRPTIRHPP